VGDILVSIDVGSSKTCTIIGRINKDNQLEIIGKGLSPCNGVKKGVIVDIESTADSIRSSAEQAESMSELKVGSAYVSIAGMHVSVVNNRSSINVASENREITSKDVEKLLYSVSKIQIPEDRQVIDVIPRQYIIDGYDEIIDPVGMVGVRLEVDADIVAGKITSVQNIVKSVEKADIKVEGLTIGAFATGEAALSPDEKEIGVILLDVGGGITDISVFQKKRLIFYDSLPIGGDHITSDISIGLKIPYTEAEKIKRQYELALTSLIMNDQEITVLDTNENRKKNVKVSQVVEIIEARVYEIFSLARNLLLKNGLESGFDSGIVLTGGGISYVDGCKQLANEVFDMPVRIASYGTPGLTKPEYATATGIIKHIAAVHKTGGTGCMVRLRKNTDKREKTAAVRKFFSFLGRFF
jgi:cell division protein FtsA